MARTTPFITNFTAGEFHPKLEGRNDVAKYFNAVRRCENFFIEPWGNITRRGGSYHVAATKHQDKLARLIEFQFNIEDQYIIEAGDQYMRFYRNYGQIEFSGSPYEIATDFLEAELREIKFVQTSDIMYMSQGNHWPKKLVRTGHTSWTISDIVFTGGGPYLDENTTATTITPSGTTGSITLTASTGIFESGHVGSFWKLSSGYVKITAFSSSTSVTATVQSALSGTGATAAWNEGSWSDVRGFPRAVGLFEQRLVFSGSTHQPNAIWASVSGDYENMTAGTADSDAYIYEMAGKQSNTAQWIEDGTSLAIGTLGGVWLLDGGGTSEPVTPSNVRVRKQTNYGASNVQAQSIGGFVYYMQRGGRTTREYQYSFEYDRYRASDISLTAKHITESGIVEMDHQQNPYDIMWLTRADGKVANMTREIDQQIVGWSKQIFGGSFEGSNAVVESIAISETPEGEFDDVWLIVKRTINGATARYVEYMKNPEFDNQEQCFFVDSGLSLDVPLVISAATKADPVVLTITGHGLTTGDNIDTKDVVGMTELNGNRYKVAVVDANNVELQDEDGVDIDGTAFTTYIKGGEARKTYTVISGLSHLEGETVKILANGAVQPDQVVASGQITLVRENSLTHVGLGYESYLETLRLEGGSATGTSQNKKSRLYKIGIRVWKTLGTLVGGLVNQDRIIFRKGSDTPGKPAPLHTGDKEINPPVGYDKDSVIVIKQSDPLPLTLLGIMPKRDVSDS